MSTVGTVTYPYERIAADLRAAILDDRLAPGVPLPSENELAATYNTTRATVRRALELLRADGLIDTRQGTRARVRAEPVVRIWGDSADWRRHRNAGLPGFNATVTEHGLTPRQEILDVANPLPAPTQVAANLGLDDGTPTVMRYVRQRADEIPVRLVRMWFPADWASGTALGHRKLICGGVPGYIGDPNGPIKRRLVDSDVELESRNPSPHERELLNLARGVTVMDVTRTFYDADERPVFMQHEIADGTKHRYRFRVPL